MAKIKNQQVAGNPRRKRNDVSVNSLNVSPTTLVAVPAPGLAIDVSDFQNYEFFNAQQTSAGTDEVILPAAAEVGTRVIIHAADIFAIGSEASSGIGINDGTDAQEITTVADATYFLTKVSATNWICIQYLAAGTVSAPTPA